MSDPSNAPPVFPPSPFPPIPPDIASTTAPILLGNLFNWGLFGVLVVQFYIYLSTFQKDRTLNKILVYSVFLLETAQTFLTAADVFYWFGSGYGNVLRLNNPYISAFDTPMLGAVVGFIVQSYFCYRIWLLQESLWWLSLIIESVAIAQGVGGFVGGIKGHLLGKFSEAHRSIGYVYVWLAGSAVADVIIAASMTYLLVRSRKSEYQHSANNVMTNLVRLTIETNAASAIVALIGLVLFAAIPNHGYYYTPTAIVGKLYSNTLLMTFNNRTTFHRPSNHARNMTLDPTIRPGSPHFSPPGLQSVTLTPTTFSEHFVGGKAVASAAELAKESSPSTESATPSSAVGTAPSMYVDSAPLLPVRRDDGAVTPLAETFPMPPSDDSRAVAARREVRRLPAPPMSNYRSGQSQPNELHG
ncbi:hypothetical protein BC834DRAFT_972795 [Gloeopeniophorella convolvens]|nr:hypothetical protein BC834DRAFT_972795 [Gloeopeniophorella convolvens]